MTHGNDNDPGNNEPRREDMARLVEQIGQGDRVLKQARLLPSGPLTDDDVAGVRAVPVRR